VTLLIPQQPPEGGAAASHSEETMDDLKKKGAANRTRISVHITSMHKINMNEPWEMDHWTKELGVSKGELQRLIEKVGNSSAAVRRELGL
jgi:hypothetical protein